jgi:quercetin dioxygenase-like cupin family protein
MSKLDLIAHTSFLAALLALSGGAALAQDPAKVAPEAYKVTSDNQYVRVLDIHLKPGGKSPMHSHPGYVAVALTPCKVRFSAPDGKSQEVEFKGGEASWRDSESHSVENLGTAECHVMNIEVKSASKEKKK